MKVRMKSEKNTHNGFTLLETMLVFLLIILLVFVFSRIQDYYNWTVLRSTGTKMIVNVEQAVKLVNVNNEDIATISFRPTDGPYTSYTISTRGSTGVSFPLPAGIRLINTNGFIREHTLRVNKSGKFVNESGMEIFNPDPGILTMTSDLTGRIIVLRLDPKTGKIQQQ